jgi:hypothetical protein
MTDEKRMIGVWEVLQGIHIGDKEVVLLHDPHNAETPYAVCYNQRDNSMGIEYTAEAVGSDDYLEMMEEFLQRVQGQVGQVRDGYDYPNHHTEGWKANQDFDRRVLEWQRGRPPRPVCSTQAKKSK